MEEIEKEIPQQEGFDELLCKKCQKHYIDKSESNYSILCSGCRKDQVRYPFPKFIIVFFVFILMACVASVLQFISIIDEYKEVILADRAYSDRYYYTANKLYSNIYEKSGKSIDKIGVKLFETAMMTYDYEQAVEMYSKHLSKKNFSDSEYQRLDPFVKKLVKYSEDQSHIANLGVTNETSMEELTNILNNVSDEDKTPFVKYILAREMASKNDYTASLALLEEIFANGMCDYIDILSQIASCYRHLSEYDKAREYAQQALYYNKENYEAIRQIAVVEILMEDYKSAIREAEKAYEICPEGLYIADVLALSYYLNGDTEKLSKIVEYATEHDLQIESYQEVSQKIKTVADIYIGGM